MTSAFFMLATLVLYFLLLLFISHLAKKGGKAKGNSAFFRAGRQSPWWMVAFGMIGASISGVTFISVPGWAASTGMTYLQMCLGFIVGYVIVALVLLPLYYRLKLTSIYTYLNARFGPRSHQTGAMFFVLSKLTGAAARLYLVCIVLCQFVVSPLFGQGLLPFIVTATSVLLLIWLYTRQSGIQTVVRTDALQTLCLLLAACGIAVLASQRLNLSFTETIQTIRESPMCYMWQWDASSKQAFWRQFLSGIFIVIVMTGLDQDMMQKNLTCRSLRDAQKDMCCYGLAFLPVNALFLALGILLYTLCQQQGIQPPANGDELLPWLVSSGELGTWVIVPFTIGIVAAAFSSADSAMTALTTTICFDLLRMDERDEQSARSQRLRKTIHFLVAFAFVLCIVLFKVVGNDNILNAIYVMASYTYGPLLGLYAFGLALQSQVNDKAVPYICLASPITCGLLDHFAPIWWGYTFGYELLMLNGLFTFIALYCVRIKGKERTL